MPIIEQYARRGEEITRITAIEALALQPPKDALRLIETLYPIEPSIAVREKMVGLDHLHKGFLRLLRGQT